MWTEVDCSRQFWPLHLISASHDVITSDPSVVMTFCLSCTQSAEHRPGLPLAPSHTNTKKKLNIIFLCSLDICCKCSLLQKPMKETFVSEPSIPSDKQSSPVSPLVSQVSCLVPIGRPPQHRCNQKLVSHLTPLYLPPCV